LIKAESIEQDLATLALDADLLARIRAAAAGGTWVVAPERVPDGVAQAGWWQVDPATGATLGYLASGEGGSPISEWILVERQMTRGEVIVALLGFWVGYGGCAGNWGTNTNLSAGRFLLCLGCGLFGLFTSAALFMEIELQQIAQKVVWGASGGMCLIGANVE
jgi:hypothetical protein